MNYLSMARHKLQRTITSPRKRKKISKIIALTRPKFKLELSEKERVILSELESKGVVKIPNLFSAQQLKDILCHLNKAELTERYMRGKARKFYLDDVPEGVRTAEFCQKHLLSMPDILLAANNELLLNVIGQYLNCKPTLSNVCAWKSFASNERAVASENYHRDSDDMRFLKVFVYLTDVDENAGPHVYIEESHKAESFLKVKRYSDIEVEKAFPDKKRIMLGKSGECFIEDTFGLHRGFPPRKTNRILLQFEYSLLPIGAYQYKNKIKATSELDSYINRLYLK